MTVEVFFEELGCKCKLENVVLVNLMSDTNILEYQTKDYIGKIPNVKYIRTENK